MKPLEVVGKICSLFMSGRINFERVYIIPSSINNNISLVHIYNDLTFLNYLSFQKVEVYKEVLYTITHKIGTGGGRQAVGGGHSAASTGLNSSQSKNNQQLPLMLKDELYSYARNAFGFSMAGHRKLLSLTAETKVRKTWKI